MDVKDIIRELRTKKGLSQERMLQIFLKQDIPVDVLRQIFAENLS